MTIKKLFLIILAILFSGFSIWYFRNPGATKTIEKIIADPFIEFRKMKVKKLLQTEKELFSEKIKGQQPEWFLEQIKEDFSYLTNKNISPEDINDAWNKVKSEGAFTRVKIIDNQIYYKVSDASKSLNIRDTEILKALSFIARNSKLPDVDFIVYFWDVLIKDLAEFKAPIFVFASNLEHRENRALMPDGLTLRDWPETYYSVLELNKEIPWEKKIEKAYWRGGTNCPFYDKDNYYKSYNIEITENNYSLCPRIKLVELSKARLDIIDAAFVSFTQFTKEVETILKKEFLLAKHATKKDHLLHKIQVNMDGNSCTSPGYKWRLISNSITFKDDAPDIQWFYRILKPYEHYIPLKQDMSDLVEKIEWVQAHDLDAKQIAEQASKLVQENLKITDIYWYLLTLLEEYSKLQNFTPEIDESFVKFEGL